MGRYFLDNGGSHILMCIIFLVRIYVSVPNPSSTLLDFTEYHKELDDVKILEALVYVYEFIQYNFLRINQ